MSEGEGSVGDFNNEEAIRDLNFAADELEITFQDAMRRAAALQALIITLENEDVRVLLLSPDKNELLPIEQHPLYGEMVSVVGVPVQIFPSIRLDEVEFGDPVDSAGNVINFPFREQ